MALSIAEKVAQQYSSRLNASEISEFILVTKMPASKWKESSESVFNCSDKRGFRYDIFPAEHPANLKDNANPRDLNVLSSNLASRGYAVYALARRGEKYIGIAALCAVVDGEGSG